MSDFYYPVRQSITKEPLVFGGERELIQCSALIAALVGVGGFTFVSAGVALLFWIGSVVCLRAMAKVDPFLSKLYFRKVLYRNEAEYSAQSSAWALHAWREK